MPSARRAMPVWVSTVAGLLLSAACSASGAPVPAGHGPDRSGSDAVAKGAVFAVPRRVIAGGGGASTGGAFAIRGTIGQVDADPLHPTAGGPYAIRAGFWPGVAPAPPVVDALFANGFEAISP